MQEETIVAEFTAQAESFNASAVATSGELLDALIELAAPRSEERWLDVACGPGIVSRRLAGVAGAVHGVDMTPAMIEVAQREARAAQIENATFAVGDATALDLADGQFDGAIARFTLHHVPLPGRVVDELARVVAPGGRVVVADHVGDDDADAHAWAQEIERLRDPSHWAVLPLARLRALGERAGLTLERERIMPIGLELEDWLRRGTTGFAARGLIERALAAPPPRAECFRVSGEGGARRLELRMWIGCWRR